MAETLSSLETITLDLVQSVGIDPQRPYLHFWITGTDHETFSELLSEDETVTGVTRYNTINDRILYRVRATEEVEVVAYEFWVELGGELLQAIYEDEWWYVRMRLPDREALAEVERWCEENDMRFVLEAVYGDEEPHRSVEGLTAEQTKTVVTALEMGYFDIPRNATLEDIADELDVSRQAISERLRRSYRELIKQHVR